MSFAILGLGTALPPHAIPQALSAEVARVICCRNEDQGSHLINLYRHTGIETRHLIFGHDFMQDVLNGTRKTQNGFLPTGREGDLGPPTSQRMQVYAEEALPLALQAARQALDRSSLAPGDLTHLVTVSCTGFAAPGLDVKLIKPLELAPTVQRTHVGFMGCHGALNGLRVAQAYTGADSEARVLLCSVELCSLHLHYAWNPKSNVANALFADGAAAVVGGPVGASPEGSWQVAATGSFVFPDSEYAMTWTIGDHGFEMTLSPRLPSLLGMHLRPWLEQWLAKNGLTMAGVRSWAVHPGGPRILSAIQESLGLSRGQLAVSSEVLAECGNMSSPTVLFILERLRQRRVEVVHLLHVPASGSHVFQDARLFPHLSVRRNLAYGRWFTPKRDRTADDCGGESEGCERSRAHLSAL